MDGNRARYGSGLYLRGRVFWLKVRTPVFLRDLRPAGFRPLSLRTSSLSEARRAARSVRAALDAGFALAGAGMRAGVFSEGETEAVITALASHALARAETLRALSGPRSEEAVRAAKDAHRAACGVWLDILRRNDLAVVEPLVAEAAALAGLAAPVETPPGDLLREAARALVAVCEENSAREDGIYVGDRDRLLTRLVLAGSPDRAAATRTEPHAGPAYIAHAASAPVISAAPRRVGSEGGFTPVLVWNAVPSDGTSQAFPTRRDVRVAPRPAAIVEGAPVARPRAAGGEPAGTASTASAAPRAPERPSAERRIAPRDEGRMVPAGTHLVLKTGASSS